LNFFIASGEVAITMIGTDPTFCLRVAGPLAGAFYAGPKSNSSRDRRGNLERKAYANDDFGLGLICQATDTHSMFLIIKSTVRMISLDEKKYPVSANAPTTNPNQTFAASVQPL
jgi:hypothetical protein